MFYIDGKVVKVTCEPEAAMPVVMALEDLKDKGYELQWEVSDLSEKEARHALVG